MSGSLVIIDLVFNRATLMLPVRDNGAEEGSIDYHLVDPFQLL